MSIDKQINRNQAQTKTARNRTNYAKFNFHSSPSWTTKSTPSNANSSTRFVGVMNCRERFATLRPKWRRTVSKLRTALTFPEHPTRGKSSTLKLISRKRRMKSWSCRKMQSTWRRTTWSCSSCVMFWRRPRDSSTKKRPSITMQSATTWSWRKIHRRPRIVAVWDSSLEWSSVNAFPALNACCGVFLAEMCFSVRQRLKPLWRIRPLWAYRKRESSTFYDFHFISF